MEAPGKAIGFFGGLMYEAKASSSAVMCSQRELPLSDLEFLPSTRDRLPRLEDTEKGTETPEDLPMVRAVVRARLLSPSEAIGCVGRRL